MDRPRIYLGKPQSPRHGELYLDRRFEGDTLYMYDAIASRDWQVVSLPSGDELGGAVLNNENKSDS